MRERKQYFKPLIIILAVIILLVGGYFAYNAFLKKSDDKPVEPEKSQITPLLYEVTKEGSSNKMYLFGSIHATKPDDLVFPEYILNAYNNSHYVACEANVYAYQQDQEAQLATSAKLVYTDGTTLKDHLSSETYTKLVNFLTERNVYTEASERYTTFYFDSIVNQFLVSDAKLSSSSGIDLYFLKKATEDNKTIIEVESMDYQVDLFSQLPDGLFDILFNALIDDYDKNISDLNKLYEAWKKGDATELITYAGDDIEEKETYTEEQLQYIREYNDTLIKDRNNNMAQKAIEYFNNDQDVFFMVGALHIVGDTGLAKQLEENGFIVTQVK